MRKIIDRSLTSVVGKLMKKIIRDEMMSYLIENKLISENQHGFVPMRSCTTNLLEFLDRVTAELDNGNLLGVIYTDFSKALDKVSHQKLLIKLQSYGFNVLDQFWDRFFLLYLLMNY